jgi:FG-GAP-like repeat
LSTITRIGLLEEVPSRMNRTMKSLCFLIVGLLSVFLSGCGGGGNRNQLPPAAIMVSVSPTSATLMAAQTKQFTATVTNDGTQRGVTWTIAGCTGGASVCGSVSPASTASGVPTTYTAPASAPGSGTLQVTATSASDSSKSGSATVTITAASAITVSVSPRMAALTADAAQTQQFIATVMNDANNQGVNWSTTGCSGGTLACGWFSPLSTASGVPTVYTPPTSMPGSGTVQVTATSVSDPSKSDSATVTVAPSAVTVSLSPLAATLTMGGTQAFNAVVSNDSANLGVIWSVSNCSAGPHACGYFASSTQNGVLYAVPDAPQLSPPSITVTATSAADSSRSASAVVTIVPGPFNFSTQNLTAGTAPTGITVQDFNADGLMDVAVANYGNPSAGDPGDIGVFLGNGNGTFKQAKQFPAGNNPIFSASGDFNNDGSVDLVVSDFGARQSGGNGALSVLLGNGDGTFRTPSSLSAGEEPFSLAVGDFNGDGSLDIAVSDFGGRSSTDFGGVYILLGRGDGTFMPAVLTSAGENPVAIVASDLNGDRKLDLAVADQHDPASTSHGGVSILLGNGDGSFQTASFSPIFLFPTSISTGDLNNDHAPDLVISSFISVFGLSKGVLNIWIGDGAGNFTSHGFFTGSTLHSAASVFPISTLVADFDGDGKNDVAEIIGNYVGLLRGNGDGTFSGQFVTITAGEGRFQGPLFFSAGTGSFQLALGEFNGDGKADLAVANRGSNDVSILLNTSP